MQIKTIWAPPGRRTAAVSGGDNWSSPGRSQETVLRNKLWNCSLGRDDRHQVPGMYFNQERQKTLHVTGGGYFRTDRALSTALTALTPITPITVITAGHCTVF